MSKKAYAVTDIWLAAYLTARGGGHLPDWQKTEGRSIVFFFEWTDELKDWITDYLNDKDMARSTLDAFRALKTLIYTEVIDT